MKKTEILYGYHPVLEAIRSGRRKVLEVYVSNEKRIKRLDTIENIASSINVPVKRKLFLLVTSLLPPVLLILAVLGTIFFGIAAPTEAAAMGAIGALILALGYRSLSLKAIWEYQSARRAC